MSIDTTYRKLILDNYIKEQLSQGTVLTAEDLIDAATTLLATLDLSIPQFDSEEHYVTTKTSSSASTIRNTFETIRSDLRALYKEMINLTQTSVITLERWQTESAVLEKQLIDLEERIDDLLLLIQDINPQQGIIVDNFTDMYLIDKSLTTALVDLQTESVQLGPTSTSVTRIFLNNLDAIKDVTFKVRTTIGFISRIDAVETDLTYPFLQKNQSWWTSIKMKSIKPVTCEYTVKLGSEATNVSKIFIELRDSVEASPIVITPLYSTDNINFSQLPTNTFTQEVRNTAVFQFSEVSAKWIKFILTKRGPDLSSSTATTFSYEFGFKEISFFAEAFDDETEQSLYSQPLSVTDKDGTPLEFEKISLETCERIETDTNIRYFVTTSNTSSVPVSASTVWSAISPINRSETLYPKILTVGNIDEAVLGNDTNTMIPVNPSNLSSSFYLVSEDVNGDIQTTTETPTSDVYLYKNSNDRILNYHFKDQQYTGSGDTAIQFNDRTLQVFRNVGEQGLDPTDTNNQVREILRGWRFEDPYYICVVQIDNPEGLSIDVGDFPIIVDEISYTNKINNNVLTGKYGENTGIHKIKIHKSRWKYVTPNKTTLSALKSADPLYPYNHKLLIEGYQYDASYPDTSDKIYTGVDLFAETLMTKVSPFDIYSNVQVDNYDVYALDKDAVGTHNNSKPTKVILLKVDEDATDADIIKEEFVVKFTRINQLKQYLRLRADFSTNNTKITPALHAYKLKLG